MFLCVYAHMWKKDLGMVQKNQGKLFWNQGNIREFWLAWLVGTLTDQLHQTDNETAPPDQPGRTHRGVCGNLFCKKRNGTFRSCSEFSSHKSMRFVLTGSSPFSQRKRTSSRSTRTRRKNGYQRAHRLSTCLITTTAHETLIVSSASRAQRFQSQTSSSFSVAPDSLRPVLFRVSDQHANPFHVLISET